MIQIPDEQPTEYLETPIGLSGYYWMTQNLICIPFIQNRNEGDGNFSRWLTELEAKGKLIFFPTIISARLDAILRKRGYKDAFVIDKQMGFVDGLAHISKTKWRQHGVWRYMQLTFEGKTIDQLAIELIQAYEPLGGYYLGFSGGKDSVVIYDLTKRAEVKFDIHYCVSPIDPPQIWDFIKTNYPEITWDYHARGFWKLVTKKGLPMRTSRWCCGYIKEAGGVGRVCILGMRTRESNTRKGYKCFQPKLREKDTFWLLPIVNWTSGDVWQYIAERNLQVCSLYSNGFDRLGCILCPFSRNIKLEMLYAPKIVKLWRLACDRLVKQRFASGKPTKHNFQTGEDLFNWWISRK